MTTNYGISSSTLCGCAGTWSMEAFAEEAVAAVRAQVGQGRVVCGLSGGVDSAVAAALVHKAVGDQLVCIFVDHGLLRKGEAEQVVETFRDEFQIQLVAVDSVGGGSRRAGRRHRTRSEAQNLSANSSSAFSRKKPGRLGDARYLVQGTLYTDVIESGGDGAGSSEEPSQRRWLARGHGFGPRGATAFLV